MSIKGLFNSLQKKNDFSKRLLYEMFYKRVYNTAYFVTKNKHLADDVVQETFIKAFRKIDHVTDSKKIGAWLSVITTRTAVDVLKKQKRRIIIPVDPRVLELELNKNPEYSELDLFVLKESVRQLIDQLPLEYQAVVILRYLYDMKEEEVASKLGISIGTVKSRVYRAKDKMRQSIIAKDRGDK